MNFFNICVYIFIDITSYTCSRLRTDFCVHVYSGVSELCIMDFFPLFLLLFKYILYYIVFLSFFPSFLFIFSFLGLPSLLVPSGLWHFVLSVGVCSLADNNNNN